MTVLLFAGSLASAHVRLLIGVVNASLAYGPFLPSSSEHQENDGYSLEAAQTVSCRHRPLSPYRLVPRFWREKNSCSTRRSHRTLCQISIGEPTANDGAQRTDEAACIGILPLVEPEGLLIEVAEQMEWLDADVGSPDAALEQAPEVLKTVGVDLPVYISLRMVDDAMDVFAAKALIRPQFIGVDVRSGCDAILDLREQAAALGVLYHPDLDAALALLGVALQKPHDDSLSAPAGFMVQSPETARPVHVLGASTDEGLIDLHVAAHLLEGAGLHRKANAMEHEPSGFLSHPKGAANLVGADAVLAVGNQPHRGEPLVQAEGAVLEDGADLGGKLFLAASAFPDQPSLEKPDFLGLAMRAGHATRPAQRHHEVERNLPVSEVVNRFEKGFGDSLLGFHEGTIRAGAGCVKYIIALARVQAPPVRPAGRPSPGHPRDCPYSNSAAARPAGIQSRDRAVAPRRCSA